MVYIDQVQILLSNPSSNKSACHLNLFFNLLLLYFCPRLQILVHVEILLAGAPGFMFLGQQGADEPLSRGFVWEDPDDPLSTADLLDQLLQSVVVD